MDIIGIGYLGFESPNLDAWREYAPQVLGLGLGNAPAGDPDSLYLRSDDRRHRIAFHPGPIDHIAYIGWEARGRQAFDAAVARFRATGVALEIGDDALREIRGVRELCASAARRATSTNSSTDRSGRRARSFPVAPTAVSSPTSAASAISS